MVTRSWIIFFYTLFSTNYLPVVICQAKWRCVLVTTAKFYHHSNPSDRKEKRLCIFLFWLEKYHTLSMHLHLHLPWIHVYKSREHLRTVYIQAKPCTSLTKSCHVLAFPSPHAPCVPIQLTDTESSTCLLMPITTFTNLRSSDYLTCTKNYYETSTGMLLLLTRYMNKPQQHKLWDRKSVV